VKLPKQLAEWLLVAFLIGQVIMTAYIFQFHASQEKPLDCSMAEFHPDFTPKMKEQCRMERTRKL
jgi:hypothetical protein